MCTIIYIIIRVIGCVVYWSLHRFQSLVGQHVFTNINKYLIIYIYCGKLVYIVKVATLKLRVVICIHKGSKVYWHVNMIGEQNLEVKILPSVSNLRYQALFIKRALMTKIFS
jgi:hypothetical protein